MGDSRSAFRDKPIQRIVWNTVSTVGCLAIVFMTSVWAQAATPTVPDPKPAAPPAPVPAAPGQGPTQTSGKRLPAEGRFGTEVLAGGSVNQLTVGVAPAVIDNLSAKIAWPNNTCDATTGDISVRSKESMPNDITKTILGVYIPEPPCWWPMTQPATILIQGNLEGAAGMQTFFNQTPRVSIFWFPLLVTLLAIAIIYPGCAITVWMLRRYQFRRRRRNENPTFLSTLDPVQITANPYGRASLAKLQIFLFTLIVFGLLLFFLLRTSVLAVLSEDILILMGISAVGAAGGKIALVSKRRLRFENWAWLRRKGWLPADSSDIAKRAKWSELFLDSDTNEFDPYSFQMAIFSLVVAVALVTSNLSQLGSFTIPDQLLALLGLSQVVFIGGKAIEKSSYNDLDTKLNDVRDKEAKFREARVKSGATVPDTKAARDTLTAAVVEAAEGFAAIFREQLPPDKRYGVDDLVELAEKDLP